MRRALFLFSLVSLVVIVGLPMIAIFLFAIFPEFNTLSFERPFSGFSAALSDADLVGATLNSLMLSSTVTVLSIVLGLPLGFFRARLADAYGRLWDVVFLVPFLIPPYIGSLAWMQLLQRNGFVEQLMGFNLANTLYSFFGLSLVMALHLFPLVYFAASRSFMVVGERYADVARVFGAKPWRVFARIHWPLAVPAVISSGLMVFILTIEEFGTPEILGRRFGFDVMVTAIHDKFTDWPIDLSGASILCLLLILIAFIAFQLHTHISARYQAQIQSRDIRSTQSGLSGVFAALVMSSFTVVALLAVLLPVASITVGAFMQRLSGGLAIDNLGWSNFGEVFSADSDALEALATSLSLATAAAIATVLIGLIVGFTVVRMRSRMTVVLDFLSILPNSIPGMAVAVGLILTWNLSFWPITPYNSIFILLLAYMCLMLPYPIRMLTAQLKQLPESLDQAALVSGASELTVIFRILMPLLMSTALAAGCIVFAISTRELVSSLMLAPPGVETVATFVFRQFDQGSINVGMAMSLIAIVLSGSVIGIGQLLQRNAMR